MENEVAQYKETILCWIVYQYKYSASHGISQTEALSVYFSSRKKVRLKARERQGKGNKENRGTKKRREEIFRLTLRLFRLIYILVILPHLFYDYIALHILWSFYVKSTSKFFCEDYNKTFTFPGQENMLNIIGGNTLNFAQHDFFSNVMVFLLEDSSSKV